MEFTVYNISTGEILRSGYAPNEWINLQTSSELEAVHLGEALDASMFFFVDGQPIQKPNAPSNFHSWDWSTKSWLPNLDAARESQLQAWNAWRDRELVAGHSHNGHVFHSDDRFMAELQLILKGYERGHLTGTFAIRTRDNSTLQMTHAEIESLLLLIGLHRQAIYAQSWVGKDALAGLTTLEDIVAGGPPS